MGGVSDDRKPLSSILAYDPETDSWSTEEFVLPHITKRDDSVQYVTTHSGRLTAVQSTQVITLAEGVFEETSKTPIAPADMQLTVSFCESWGPL